MSEHDGVVVAISSFFRVMIPNLALSTRHAIIKLAEGPCSEQRIDAAILATDDVNALAVFYYYLSYLTRHQMVHVRADDVNGEISLATLIPISPNFKYKWVVIEPDQPYRLSRFAYLRRAEDDASYLESPLSHARVRLDHPLSAMLIHLLGTAITLTALTRAIPEVDEAEIIDLLALLIMGDFAVATTSEGRSFEDNDATLMQWDFHDLLFHSRSRMGRHNNVIGGTFRFLHSISPQPAARQAQWPYTVQLPRPNMLQILATDPSLTAVMEARASIRAYGARPITVTQLGEFLYRVARIKEFYSVEDKGDFTKRPYPNGGASYEMEFYLTVDQCEDLPSGFYWYDPVSHALAFIQRPNEDTEGLLYDAYRATGGLCRPQVLITLAARFQRVSWKYQGMAYATILKNVGVIYSNMYLVATAMGLAPCALGLGDSDRFSRLANTDYLKETSVGEFMLGSRPA